MTQNDKDAEELRNALDLLTKCEKVLDSVVEEKNDKKRFWETRFGLGLAKCVSVMTHPFARAHEKSQEIIYSPQHYYDSKALKEGYNMLRLLKKAEAISGRTIKKVCKIRRELTRNTSVEYQTLNNNLKNALQPHLKPQSLDLKLLPTI